MYKDKRLSQMMLMSRDYFNIILKDNQTADKSLTILLFFYVIVMPCSMPHKSPEQLSETILMDDTAKRGG